MQSLYKGVIVNRGWRFFGGRVNDDIVALIIVHVSSLFVRGSRVLSYAMPSLKTNTMVSAHLWMTYLLSHALELLPLPYVQLYSSAVEKQGYVL